ncbi:MAG: fatty acid desaturase [Candidatus Obscuribacterales bacterium]|nr:fatty acid desaturase [Candidatus Obscuribacterales bacterium]
MGTVVSFTLWFLASYLYVGLGVTLGYHRLLTHKALKVPRWLMYLIVSGGYFCLMGAPIVWVGVHRLHHQKSDLEGDPHSPVVGGFKHALYGWMFNTRAVQTDEELQAQCPDLMKDPLFRLLGTDHEPYQAQLCLALNVLLRVIILALFGWPAVIANILATTIVFWSPQFVNTFCHLKDHGYRTYETRDASRNVWWVALLSLGEGWHNNHHAVPKSARHGMAVWEIDVTWISIWLLEKVGLAKNVIRPPATLKARASLVNAERNALTANVPTIQGTVTEIGSTIDSIMDAIPGTRTEAFEKV